MFLKHELYENIFFLFFLSLIFKNLETITKYYLNKTRMPCLNFRRNIELILRS